MGFGRRGGAFQRKIQFVTTGMYLQGDGTKMAWVKMSHGKQSVLAVAVVVLRNADCRRVGV